MATRNVVLTETQSDLVDRLVASGRYQNASEALRAGLRLLEREEAELGALRSRLTAGLEQARRGDLAEGSGEPIAERLDLRLEANDILVPRNDVDATRRRCRACPARRQLDLGRRIACRDTAEIKSVSVQIEVQPRARPQLKQLERQSKPVRRHQQPRHQRP